MGCLQPADDIPGRQELDYFPWQWRWQPVRTLRRLHRPARNFAQLGLRCCALLALSVGALAVIYLTFRVRVPTEVSFLSFRTVTSAAG